MVRCPDCGKQDRAWKETVQTFTDGSKHIRQACATCGAFHGWKPQANSSFKDELFFLVRDLATAEARDFSVLQFRAAELIKKVTP